MHIVVIGAGIIGVTTAYFLRRDGHDVTVIERRSGVAQETSFANAGVMAPSYVAPWSQPGMPAKVLSYLFKAEAPIVFRPSLDPALWRWIARWLGECRLERFTRNKARMQRLAFYSQSELRALRELHQLDYEQTTGYLQLFRTHIEVERSAVTRKMLTELGVAHRLLSTDEAHALEPALHAPTRLAGALHLPNDETGNCAFFAQQLKEIAISDGVDFRFNVAVQNLQTEAAASHRQLRTETGVVNGDAFVVAGGIDSVALLRPLGIRAADAAGQGLLCNGRHHRVRACAVHQRDGRNVQGRDHSNGQVAQNRRHRRAGHARYAAARQRVANVAEGGAGLVSLRCFVREIALLDRRASDAARRSSGAGQDSDHQFVRQHRTRLDRLGHVMRFSARAGRRHRADEHRRSISTA